MSKIHEEVFLQFKQENINRVPRLALIAAVFGLVQLSLLFRASVEGNPLPYAQSLFVGYLIFTVLGFGYAIIGTFAMNQDDSRLQSFVIITFIGFGLAFGTFFSLLRVDWMGDILAYSLSILIVAVVFYMPKRFSYILFLLQYLGFFFMMNVTDWSETLIFSARINAFLITLFALFVNQFLTRQFKLVFEQTLLIHKQAELLKHKNEELKEMAYVDALTGFLSRQRFVELFHHQLLYNQRYDNESVLLLLDVDDFKRYNDTYGHLSGDVVLTIIAQRLRDCLRESDILGRWGGDEFLVLLPVSSIEESKRVIEKIMRAISRDAILLDGHWETPSLSVGYALVETSWESTMAVADKQLYSVKDQHANDQNFGQKSV